MTVGLTLGAWRAAHAGLTWWVLGDVLGGLLGSAFIGGIALGSLRNVVRGYRGS